MKQLGNIWAWRSWDRSYETRRNNRAGSLFWVMLSWSPALVCSAAAQWPTGDLTRVTTYSSVQCGALTYFKTLDSSWVPLCRPSTRLASTPSSFSFPRVTLQWNNYCTDAKAQQTALHSSSTGSKIWACQECSLIRGRSASQIPAPVSRGLRNRSMLGLWLLVFYAENQKWISCDVAGSSLYERHRDWKMTVICFQY